MKTATVTKLPTKPTAAKNATPKPARSLRAVQSIAAADIDRLGTLKEIIDEIEVERDEFDALKKRIIYAANDEGEPEAELVLHGKKYTLVLGARTKERKVKDLRALFDKLGLEAFLRCVGARLAELDKLKMDLSDVIEESIASRKMKSLARAR